MSNTLRFSGLPSSLVPYAFAGNGNKWKSLLIRDGDSSMKCLCSKNDEKSETLKSFSVLKANGECDIGSIWSTLGFYVFTIHVPLSFGSLSVASKILHQPALDPLQTSFLILGTQTLELSIFLLLLKFEEKHHYDLRDLICSVKSSEERSSLLASVVGSGFLLSLVLVTSFFSSRFIGAKVPSNEALGEILSSGPISATACVLSYCIVIPLLEEVVYRGFLLKSLISELRWPQAVVLSSIVFSAAHFSSEKSLQLFVVGLVLGCAYCWTGKLGSSIAIHSSYNAVVLLLTFLSLTSKQ